MQTDQELIFQTHNIRTISYVMSHVCTMNTIQYPKDGGITSVAESEELVSKQQALVSKRQEFLIRNYTC